MSNLSQITWNATIYLSISFVVECSNITTEISQKAQTLMEALRITIITSGHIRDWMERHPQKLAVLLL
ncbi:MAG: hypothetical protein M3247_05630 [Thermoproteota archaeon]|nr:hypothetical protein [Thermoproteota archaeon]